MVPKTVTSRRDNDQSGAVVDEYCINISLSGVSVVGLEMSARIVFEKNYV
jgi:hypothetical protein